MKIALIQINPIIGDFSHNIKKMTDWLGHAAREGCRLAIFPELAVSGYPPLDLLERPSFIRDQEKALHEFIRQVGDTAVVCGAFTRNTAATGKPLRNSAIFIKSGRIHAQSHKALLPSYDVFDETRYFEPGSGEGTTITLDARQEVGSVANTRDGARATGLRLGLTICEDIWNDPDLFSPRLYPCDPAARLFSATPPPELVINIAASPFHLNKFKVKHTIFQNLCTKYDTAFVYVNQVGGQDSLIFDGMSLAMTKSGRIAALAEKFSEDCLIVDTESLLQADRQDGAEDIPCTASNCAFRTLTTTLSPRAREQKESATHARVEDFWETDQQSDALNALVLGVRDYTRKCGFTKALVGLSGGIDSALTAVIATRALGAANVLGVALPSHFTSEASTADARQLATNLGIDFKVIPIAPVVDSMSATLAPHFVGLSTDRTEEVSRAPGMAQKRPADVTEQNLQARIRGNLLMAFSNKFGVLLLSTGNKSEMAVGYCTLYGDMSGGLAVIADVPKMLVYELAEYINREGEIIPRRTITRPPTAELAFDQKDEDDLPPYAVLDPIVAAYLEDQKGPEEIIAMGFAREVVHDVIRRIKTNEYKRKQAPLGLKLTTKAFGIGRRYPTAERYREW